MMSLTIIAIPTDLMVKDPALDNRWTSCKQHAFPYAVLMLDPTGVIMTAQGNGDLLRGARPSELAGRHFSAMWTGTAGTTDADPGALETAATRGAFRENGVWHAGDAINVPATIAVAPVQGAGGELSGFCAVVQRAETDTPEDSGTHETEEQFRILVQGVTDYAIFMLSPTGMITSWNPGAARIKGYGRDEIIGRHFSCFYTEEDRAAGAPAYILATAAQVGRVEREGWRVRKDGSRFWAHVVVDAIRDGAGELVGFAKVTRDITERKEAEAALDKANAALFQAQKMEAIGRLTGGVAHDFNNLLAVLANGLQVLVTQSRTHLDTKMIDAMRRAVERGASLTQQLMAFARQQPLQAETLDLNVLIRDFEPVLVRARDRNAACVLQLATQPAVVTVDATRFEAALLNLVVNAVDAMPESGRATIRTEVIDSANAITAELPAGRYIRVSVSDTGIGMSSDVIERAFEPFFTTKPPGKGTGLGLSQVYGFIVQSGGDVVVTSEEGKGTTVDLYLPAATPADAAPVGAAPSRERVETVLLVEDEPDVLALAAELFRTIGYEVVVASSADEAAGILAARQDIDVVFTDIAMPHGMSGIELARLVRSDHPRTKAVLTSGYPVNELRREHGSLDEFPFVHKPYRLADLAKALRS